MERPNFTLTRDLYAELVKKIKDAKIKHNINVVYLATDDFNAGNIIKDKICDIELIQYTNPPDLNGNPIHMYYDDKKKIIFNCLLDIYMILKSDIFIPCTSSGLSRWILYMMQEKKNIFNIENNTIILF